MTNQDADADNQQTKEEEKVEVVGTDKAGNTIIRKNGKTYVQRKELPSVKHLLAHGDPETAHLPKTWVEIIGYPVALALVFGISLVIFHHAAQHMPARKKYSIPGMQRLPIFDRMQHQHPHSRMEEMRRKAQQVVVEEAQKHAVPLGDKRENTEL
jgi:hypothetical protein